MARALPKGPRGHHHRTPCFRWSGLHTKATSVSGGSVLGWTLNEGHSTAQRVQRKVGTSAQGTTNHGTIPLRRRSWGRPSDHDLHNHPTVEKEVKVKITSCEPQVTNNKCSVWNSRHTHCRRVQSSSFTKWQVMLHREDATAIPKPVSHKAHSAKYDSPRTQEVETVWKVAK